MKNEEIAALDFSDWPLPENFLTELGRVSALWARTEWLVNVCVGKLAGFDDLIDLKPLILIVHSSFPQRLDMLSALCEQLVQEFPALTDYKAVVAKLRAAQAARNRFVHNQIGYDKENDRFEMPVATARGTLKAGVEQVHIEDIKRVSIEINEANRALYKLMFKRDVPPAWEKHDKA